MNRLYKITFPENVTPYAYYYDIIPLLHNYFEENKQDYIVFDFSNVEFINPLVIPNLLTTALILRSYFSKPVKLYIPWRPSLLSYLADIDFFSVSKRYGLFDIDERYIGDFPIEVINSECKTYFFDEKSSLTNIKIVLSESYNIIKLLHKDSGEFLRDSNDNFLKIFNIMAELCYNACLHGSSQCFATIQTNIGKNVKFKKAYISISDCGKGFYSTLLDKIRKDEDFTLNFCSKEQFLELQEEKNLIAMLEAIFYRKPSKNYGIYHIFKYIVNQDGVMRIHSEDTQLIITKNNYTGELEDLQILKDNLVGILKQSILGKIDFKYSPVRKAKSKLKGVHIEIEIPLD